MALAMKTFCSTRPGNEKFAMAMKFPFISIANFGHGNHENERMAMKINDKFLNNKKCINYSK